MSRAHWIPRDDLEPAAVASLGEQGATVDSPVGAELIQLSLAISFKRVADTLDRFVEGVVDFNRNEPYGAAVRTQPGAMRD